MAQIRRVRSGAMVNVTQTPEEVAEFLGISPDAYVDHGNGYVITIVEVVEASPEDIVSPAEDVPAPEPKPKAKPKKKATKTEEE